MALEYYNFPEDKNLDDFKEISKNLRIEKQESRADAVDYLIERCKRSQLKLKSLMRVVEGIK